MGEETPERLTPEKLIAMAKSRGLRLVMTPSGPCLRRLRGSPVGAVTEALRKVLRRLQEKLIPLLPVVDSLPPTNLKSSKESTCDDGAATTATPHPSAKCRGAQVEVANGVSLIVCRWHRECALGRECPGWKGT